MTYIFVYGTLKKDHGNHVLLAGQEYVGEFYTKSDYTLILSGLPYLVKRKGPGCLGEVYKVDDDCLARLDRLEGHPNWYKRTLIPVYGYEDDEMMEAQAYIHPDIFNESYQRPYSIIRSY